MKKQTLTADDRRNLVKRINRRLAQRDQKLETAQNSIVERTWGRNFLVDLSAGKGWNAIIRKHVNLKALANEVDAL